MDNISRRTALRTGAALFGTAALATTSRRSTAAKKDPRWEAKIERGLNWVASTQSSLGHWTAGNYPTAMTALGGTALICSGSTTTQGPYARNIRRTVDYLTTKARNNGLIGDPINDNR